MEQATFPIKTRIAARLIMIVSILIIISFAINNLTSKALSDAEIGAPFLIAMFIFLIIPAGLILFFLGFFLLKKKKWAWGVNVVLLFAFSLISFMSMIYITAEFIVSPLGVSCSDENTHFGQCFNGTIIRSSSFGDTIFSFLTFFSFFIPLILLLVDRKNFWEITIKNSGSNIVSQS